MRNFGQTTEFAPYKNYGPPGHFRFAQKGDFESIPLYTAPSYGQSPTFIPTGPQLPERSAGDKAKSAATMLALGAGGTVLVVGLLTFMPLVVWPFVIKSFRPDIPYKRRVGIGMGISIGLAAVTAVARTAFGQKES